MSFQVKRIEGLFKAYYFSGKLMATPCGTFTSDALSVLISDLESSPVATALLFNHALSISAVDGCSTIVRPTPLTALPLRLFDAPEQPPVYLVRKMEFLYLDDRADFIDYISGMHESGAPSCFIVDSMDVYSGSSASGLASLTAVLHDLGSWIKENRTDMGQGQSLSPVVCAISMDKTEHDKAIRLIGRYTSDVWKLHADEEGVISYRKSDDQKPIKMKVMNDRVALMQ